MKQGDMKTIIPSFCVYDNVGFSGCVEIWQSRRHEKATVEIIRTIPPGNLNLSRQQKNNKPKQVRTGVFVSIMVKRRMRINELNNLKCNLFGYSGRGVQIRAGRLDMGLEGMKQKYFSKLMQNDCTIVDEILETNIEGD